MGARGHGRGGIGRSAQGGPGCPQLSEIKHGHLRAARHQRNGCPRSILSLLLVTFQLEKFMSSLVPTELGSLGGEEEHLDSETQSPGCRGNSPTPTDGPADH